MIYQEGQPVRRYPSSKDRSSSCALLDRSLSQPEAQAHGYIKWTPVSLADPAVHAFPTLAMHRNPSQHVLVPTVHPKSRKGTMWHCLKYIFGLNLPRDEA